MTHDKEFWERAISVDNCEPEYGVNQMYVDYPKVFATVNLNLVSTPELDYLMDEFRTVGGQKPFLYAEDEDETVAGWYNYYINLNDLDGGCVDNAISCIVSSDFAEDDGEYYVIPLDEDDRKMVWDVLDQKLRKDWWEHKGCKEILAEAREWLKKELESA